MKSVYDINLINFWKRKTKITQIWNTVLAVLTGRGGVNTLPPNIEVKTISAPPKKVHLCHFIAGFSSNTKTNAGTACRSWMRCRWFGEAASWCTPCRGCLLFFNLLWIVSSFISNLTETISSRIRGWYHQARKMDSANHGLAIFLLLYCFTFALVYLILPDPTIFLVTTMHSLS